MRFDAEAPFPEMVKTIPHVVFEVADPATSDVLKRYSFANEDGRA